MQSQRSDRFLARDSKRGGWKFLHIKLFINGHAMLEENLCSIKKEIEKARDRESEDDKTERRVFSA